MVTKEQAQATKAALLPDAVQHKVSIAVIKEGDDYIVRLGLPHKRLAKEFPKEKNGVKVVAEVDGPAAAFDRA